MMGAYSFGRFTLDPAEHRLYAAGVPVPLGSTDMRLLLILVERAGKTVTKDELISRVWGRTVVSDHVLYVHINTLRKALGDDCIVNKQGCGYRFMPAVQQTERRAPPRPVALYAGNLTSRWAGNGARGPFRLIGRGEQLSAISQLLRDGRLVTLTGHGGVGKTRLAVEAACAVLPLFCDGVWLVELAALSEGSPVPPAIALALGVEVGDHVTPLDALSRQLARKSLLVVLDNCEHVLAACAHTTDALLAALPGLKILATSREALSCSGERILDVPPLAVATESGMPAADMRSVAAIELFLDRATNGDASFRISDDELPIVARICRRLDGLPLAIEMAAGWTSVLGIEALGQKLDQSLNGWLRARSTAPLRHSTLNAVLEWSYGLLSTVEQDVLCRLAVFAGSFTMPAAEAIAERDHIPSEQIFEHVASLVRKSMIAATPGSTTKQYRLLETTRTFLLDRLARTGNGDAARHRHARFVLEVLEQATRKLETTSDAAWVARYGPLLDDLRAALDWAMENSDVAVALAGASWPLWRELSLRAEGKLRLGAAAMRLHADTPPALEARLRRGLGDLSLDSASIATAHSEIARAATLYRAQGDGPHLGSALSALAYPLVMLGRADEADDAIREAIALLESAGWLRTLARAYANQSCINAIRGRFGAALAAGEKAVYFCEIVGIERTALVVAANLVQLRLENGDIDGAIAAGRSTAQRLRDTRHSDILGFVLGVLAGAMTARSDLNDALVTAREAAPLLREAGTLFWLFDHLALRTSLAGRVKDAALISGYANSVQQKSGRPREPMGRRAMEQAEKLLREALPEAELAELKHLGAQLSEDQAIGIALSN